MGLPGSGFGTAPRSSGSGAPKGPTDRPRILSPGSNPHGHTYGEWSAAWWNWALAIPAAVNPLMPANPGQEDWTLGQQGLVWFLPGAPSAEALRLTEGDTGRVTIRSYQVPQGKSLFFPIAAFVRFAPDDLVDVRALLNLVHLNEPAMSDESRLGIAAAWFTHHVEDLSCSIDGILVTNLTDYLTDSPPFALEVSDVLSHAGVEPGRKGPAVSDGFWIMLAPLAVGRHTIQLSGSIRCSQEAGDPLDLFSSWATTYQVSVVAGPP